MKRKFHNVKVLISIFVCFLLLTACSSSNTTESENNKSPQSIEELQKKLENVLKDTNTPGLSIAIMHKAGPEWIAGLGKANVANNQAATAETLFRVGSTSKAFASLAILKLADQGKLSLEDPVHKLAPDVWFENPWEANNPIRLVHLLEHTTGWDDMHLREHVKTTPTISLSEAFDYDHSSRISRWQPGTRMAYCNSGPPVAAYIVEKITGQKFENYIDENFFKPIGMLTATYFQPQLKSASTLYHNDGISPYHYWDIIYRPSFAINASAIDMANYLYFYLNHGNVNGKQIIKFSDIDLMRIPKSTWAAKEGLKTGYGLGNYWTIHDGFVYHGHDGSLDGGLTAMEYMPDKGIGYFYSINAANSEAFNKIGKIIRSYITRHLQRPAVPPIASLPENVFEYTGWYRRDSPRIKLTYFLERLLGIAYIHFEEGKLLMTSLSEYNATFLPVVDSQFRYVSKSESADPVPSVKLLTPNDEGQFIQIGLGMTTIKRIPAWLGILEIIAVGFVLLSTISILIYAPFWILGGLIKKRRRPAERGMRMWPLVAVITLVGFIAIPILSKEDLITRMGNLTIWSFSLFLTTIAFAIASAASTVALWRTLLQEVRRVNYIYSMVVTIALVIATLYLAYWGIIGLRTWA